MKILFVAVEMSPIAKVGGLADVIGSLPKALRKNGHDARVILPFYKMIETNPSLDIKLVVEDFEVEMNPGWRKTARLYESELDGVPVYFIGEDEWYGNSVSSETLYQPGGHQHLFFCSAVLKAIERYEWTPDVIHCHDWHTGFLPVLMREKSLGAWEDTGAVFTIHNFAYQGDFGVEVLDDLALPHSLYNPNQLETWGRVNFLKAGCVFADRVNTVSRTYAQEIQTPEYGCTLEGLMGHIALQGRLTGILNGIDQVAFNPEIDPDIPTHFSASHLAGKRICKRELRKELGLPHDRGPLMGVVSRLSSQKGLDLLAQCGEAISKMGAQLVVQGVGDPALADEFACLEAQFPKNIRLVNRFDADIAQRVYASSDIFLMPSRFEPCGLGQMIAMRYGTIPVVRATGGLKDTVTDGETGFVFHQANVLDLLQALQRSVDAFQDKAAWKKMVLAAMGQDFSWDRSAKEYAALYQACVLDRLASTG
ncbi:MAG TPA: glycogen synthase [Fimbriimonas sp.]|nr:glycogen synthase [Fimbriimonas sp.]